jgi:serum/glucocorticoid-regulated kinase 2
MASTFNKRGLSSSPISTSTTSRRTVNPLTYHQSSTLIIEYKRRIDIAKLVGVTKSLSEPTGEFVLHIKNEYDYRMKSETRDQVIDVIKKLFLQLNNANLPIYGVVSLKQYYVEHPFA